jgi:hypothetical protein
LDLSNQIVGRAEEVCESIDLTVHEIGVGDREMAVLGVVGERVGCGDRLDRGPDLRVVDGRLDAHPVDVELEFSGP